jgi:RNA polymerase sigma-70 factor (sigma-E family)
LRAVLSDVVEASEADFGSFAARQLPGLLRYAAMLARDRELARDLVQDAFLKAHGQWPRMAAMDRPDLYLKAIVTREFLSWTRRWAVRNVLLADGDLPDRPTGDHAVRVVDRDDLWQRLTRLPRQQHTVLVLRYYEQLTDDEIATVLGCTAGTVRGYASRALAVLRAEYPETKETS